MDWTTLLPLAIPAAIVALSAVALVAGTLSAQAEAKQSSRIGRIEGAVARVAGGIAEQLSVLAASGVSVGSLADMRLVAIGAGAAYLKAAMPDTIAAAGATPDILHAMIEGELGRQRAAPVLAVPLPEPSAAGAAS